MQSTRTVFSQVMSTLHPQAFSRCAALHPLRRRPRGLSVYDHFLALCFAQLTYRQSLRDIEACLNARPSLAYHLGFRGHVTRTNLAYANERRDWRLFASVAQHLMHRARRLYIDSPRDFDPPQAAFALDASLIHLSARLFPWAVIGRRSSTAIKLHMLLALRGSIPAWAALTPGGFSEVRMLDELPIQPGCFYVMDRGYLDFARRRGVAQQDGFFIVRSRRKLGCVIRQPRPLDPGGLLQGDDKIELTNPHSRRCYPQPLRRVQVWDPVREKTIVLLTNHWLLPAQSVADLYRRRWQIELFFKWIKQHLCLRGFLGASPNAVQCQLWSALCVYLLVAILKKELGLHHSLHEILQILSIHPFEQSPIQELLMKTEVAKEMHDQPNLFNLNTL
jgi:hypothetical protein